MASLRLFILMCVFFTRNGVNQILRFGIFRVPLKSDRPPGGFANRSGLALYVVDLTFDLDLDPEPNLSAFEIANGLALCRPLACRFDCALAVPRFQDFGVDLNRLI